MKVSKLMEILKRQNPDANVYVMFQHEWPFENSIFGVAVRSTFTADDDEDEYKEGNGLRPDDVFIVEGGQLRYGSEKAWEVAEQEKD